MGDSWRSNISINDLNRSVSLPNVESYSRRLEDNFSNDYPIFRRVLVAQEVIQKDHSSPRILRQYSYQEIHSTSPLIRPSAFTESDPWNVSNMAFRSLKGDNMSVVDNTSDQEEPMEIDTSLDRSNNKHDEALVSEYTEEKIPSKHVDFVDQECVYQRRTKQKDKDNKSDSSPLKLDKLVVKKRKKHIPLLVRLILAVIVITASLFLVAYMIFDYNAYVDVDNLESEFSKQIHEQKDAVHAVVNSLRYNHPHARWQKSVKVLSFVGCSGVGKTLIANIVKLNFNSLFVNDLHSSQIHDIAKQDSIIDNLYSNYLNLIVIDDLNVDHLEPVISLIEKLEESDTLVLVIAIFSIQKVDDELKSTVHDEDISKIHKRFDKTHFYHEVITFDKFAIADAREYLGKKLDSYNVDVQHHNRIANRVLKDHDVHRHGFKELYSKALIEVDRMDLHI